MKRTLDSTSEPCLRASGNGDSIPGLVKEGESSPSRCATPRARDAMNCEVAAMMDSGIAIAGRKKLRSAPEEGVSQPSEETIPIASSKDGTKEVGSEACASQVANLSIIHGPSDASLSNFPAEGQFPYQPLDTSKLEIRVITLHPGIRTTPIHCSLTHITTNSKSNKPIYKALSYTWGTAEAPKTISLDGMQVQVRENLWQALYHLRSEEHELTIWIDALCINQNDLQERGSQVSRMSAIYGIAKEVIVWLGPADEDSKLAIDFIEQNFHPSSGPRVKDMPMDELLVGASELELLAIPKIMAREYWHRVWIIQEIFRARLVTVHCGHDTVRWSSLSKFFRYLSRQPAQTEFIKRRGDRQKYESLLEACTSPAKSLTEHRTSQKHCLEDLLKAYKSCRSSDPRDKVYALVGLAQRKLRTDSEPIKKGDDWIVVDYSKPALHIFRSLVLLYENAYLTSMSRWGSRREHVQWMQLLQEVLDLRDYFDSDHAHAKKITEPTGIPYLLGMELEPLEPRIKGNITCGGYRISAAQIVGDFASSPAWSPLTQDYGHILDWHKSIPRIDHSRTAIDSLELTLSYFATNDLERTKKFELSMTSTDLNYSLQVSVVLGKRYCLLIPYPIEQEYEIICFDGSDIALAVIGSAVVGRGVIYDLERKSAEVDRAHFRAAYPDLIEIYFLVRSRNTITLSIDNWVRVVSLAKRPVSK
ncbi:HET-domain-containing protein [Hyaloscypha bicolor E]|uniref:HET-domain-containing protein n=1 Tax=Hyaloscypha bicolor E TaxID=1095630 RepID=A0A2J6SL39_9HELO|nr:HET-domain-containing protein [Hyaloscypha bicolor E]PMD51488.1 HET-domain-containing protein [Hyaloscypha bicolor E]